MAAYQEQGNTMPWYTEARASLRQAGLAIWDTGIFGRAA
jgi:hypothetical protein